MRHKAACVHPLTGKPVIEASLLTIRKRERAAAAAAAAGSSSAKEHAWELVQLAPENWLAPDQVERDKTSTQVRADVGTCTRAHRSSP